MNVPKDLRYTKTHEWVRDEDGVAIVGITDFAQSQLSDVTYAELPSSGDQLAAGDESAVLESVKAASDIYSPISGAVVEVNEMLVDHPELINNDPYGDGWMYKLHMDDEAELDDLLDAETYEASLPAEG